MDWSTAYVAPLLIVEIIGLALVCEVWRRFGLTDARSYAGTQLVAARRFVAALLDAPRSYHSPLFEITETYSAAERPSRFGLHQPPALLAAAGIPVFAGTIHSLPSLSLPQALGLLLLSTGALTAMLAVARSTTRTDTDAVHTQMFNSVNQPIFIIDRTNRVIDINQAALRMLGVSRDSCLSEQLSRLLPGLDVEAALTSQEGDNAILDWPADDGRIGRYAVDCSVLKDGEHAYGHIVLLHDITALSEELAAQREAADKALQASKLSSEFLAQISHEVRTPMQAVVGMTGMLLGTELTDEQRDYVETIRSSGDSMLSIVNNVLDFSKVEAGQIELEHQPFDPLAAIEDTLSIFAGQAAMKNLELAYVAGDNVPAAVLGDVTRFRQVLTNLVGNGVKFTERGEVTVYIDGETTSEEMRLHVRVRDTGIGIPEDRIDRLFHSFSQADASTARRYGGTGLGLAISKRLCEVMGGDIWVESHTGVGSTFHFTVATETVESSGLGFAPDSSLKGRSALVVDDNPASRQMISKMLDGWGMRAETVESGWAALQVLESNAKFDVILIDMHMPVMDGEACARRIRGMRYRPEPRLVMMLALTDSDIRAKASNLGLSSIVVKPIRRSQLRSTLSDLFVATEKSQISEEKRSVAAPPDQGGELTVLLADDNRVGQRVTSALLRRLGYKADVVSSGKEVLAALETRPYDVVLMDVYMPEMDGLTATQEIRQASQIDPQPYVIALTASAVSSDRQQCLNAGMNDYLSKPVTIVALQEALQRAQESIDGNK